MEDITMSDNTETNATVSEEVSTGTEVDSPDTESPLAYENKKYRKRAQDSEAKLEKMLKEKDTERQKQMEAQNEWPKLAEERALKLQELEPIVDQFTKDDANQLEMILADFNDSAMDQF